MTIFPFSHSSEASASDLGIKLVVPRLDVKTMKSLTIEKGWYFGAGSPKMYNWVKDGYDIFGVGISLDFLKGTDKVEIIVDKKPYILVTQDAVDFARKYNTERVMKGGTHIIVVSKSILTSGELLQVIEA